MATPTPQLGKTGKYGDLKKRLTFLLLALVVFRIGAHIPAPGCARRSGTRPTPTAETSGASSDRRIYRSCRAAGSGWPSTLCRLSCPLAQAEWLRACSSLRPCLSSRVRLLIRSLPSRRLRAFRVSLPLCPIGPRPAAGTQVRPWAHVSAWVEEWAHRCCRPPLRLRRARPCSPRHR